MPQLQAHGAQPLVELTVIVNHRRIRLACKYGPSDSLSPHQSLGQYICRLPNSLDNCTSIIRCSIPFAIPILETPFQNDRTTPAEDFHGIDHHRMHRRLTHSSQYGRIGSHLGTHQPQYLGSSCPIKTDQPVGMKSHQPK